MALPKHRAASGSPRAGHDAVVGRAWLVTAGGAALLVAMTLAAFAPALRGGFIWDDHESVEGNAVLRDPAGLWRIWIEHAASDIEPHYWPITYSTLWLETQLFGTSPLIYHLTNVLLHAGNALLVWFLLRRLRVPGAWWTAALFALHPVHVESVAWIMERKDVLSGCFYLAALLTCLRFERTRRGAGYAAALGLFVCAVLSKSMAVTLPAALVLVLWWAKDHLGWADLLWTAPFWVIAAVLAGVDVHLGHEAETVVPGLSPLAKVLLAGRALWFYVDKTYWPSPLMAIYARWSIDLHEPSYYIYTASALLVPVVLWKARRRLGKGPLIAVLFFGLTLGPVLGFVEFRFMEYSFVADRFLYLPILGLLALLVGVATQVAERLGPRARWLGPVMGTPILLVLGALTWQQSGLYRDSETFWRANVERNPQAWAVHYNLGEALARNGRPPEEVIPHLVTALTLNPACADAHNRLGMEYARRRDLRAAVWHFGEAVRIDPPYQDAVSNLAKAHHHLALELVKRGQLDEAIDHFQEALESRPGQTEVRFNLAVALAQRGRWREAVVQLDELLRLAPGDVPARALRDRLAVRDRGMKNGE